jgi:Zn-dependent peptidase ImmA (M78 family)/transcriptional regulator with XRE-family HTH domain
MSLTNPLASIDPRELGARLKAARKARGLTQADVADHLDVARTTVTAMESGERELQPAELARLARLFGRSISELVERQEPAEPFAVQFRSVMVPGEATDDLEASIFDFQRLCEDYVTLERLLGAPLTVRHPPPYEFDEEHPERSAEDLANRERHRLGLGDGPCPNLRELLESDVGLRVFYVALPSRVAAMFAYGADFGGCIAVNRNHPPERRRHSLAHEYGHFVTERFRPEVNVLGRYQRVPASERFAEAFARAFLLPATGLTRRFNDLKKAKTGPLTVADLYLLAHLFFVSVQAMARRLEELRLIGAGTWDRLQTQGLRVREAQSQLGLPAQLETEHALPFRYQYLAVAAFAAGELSEGQLARFLRTDRVHARRVAAGLASRVAVSDEGLIDRGALDLSTVL